MFSNRVGKANIMKSVGAIYKNSAGVFADRISGTLFLTDTHIFFDLHPIYGKPIIEAWASEEAMNEAATWSASLEQVAS